MRYTCMHLIVSQKCVNHELKHSWVEDCRVTERTLTRPRSSLNVDLNMDTDLQSYQEHTSVAT